MNKLQKKVLYKCNCKNQVLVCINDDINVEDSVPTVVDGQNVFVVNTVVCSICHPIFSGERRIIDDSGILDKFMKKYSYTTQTNNKDKK